MLCIAYCTHCAIAVARYYCHFDAIKIERTTKTHVIGMKKKGGRKREREKRREYEIVQGDWHVNQTQEV